MEQVPGSTKFYGCDTNPGTGTMTAEFDCPADAWFFHGASQDDFMPYSILMEIALQTCGILTTWNKAPLTMSETVKKNDLLFRNLDATAKLLAKVDLRGKTIKNVSTATGYAMLGSMGVQKFTTMMSVDGVDFYQCDSSFGWFLPEVFETQVGLDNGVYMKCWHEREAKVAKGGLEKAAHALAETFNLKGGEESRIFAPAGPSYNGMGRRSEQTRFIDGITMIADSGMHGMGYANGFKTVDVKDWFFSCHFWCDPVMPGSLGIESMHQSLELLCVKNQWAAGMRSPRFEHDLGQTKWCYRGQLTPKNKRLDCEVHVKKKVAENGGVTVHADGYLYVDGLRVYSATDLRLRIVEA
jgi:3-hydroxymyristoyl/3-hydroxydecanoyl-(acyl carrier protein) dehydratase